jgi:hypothetical protein
MNDLKVPRPQDCQGRKMEEGEGRRVFRDGASG